MWADIFLKWQDRQTDPWAACINLMDAHSLESLHPDYHIWGNSQLTSIFESLDNPWAGYLYTDREPWWKLDAIEALYDNGIRQADEAVSKIVNQLRQRGEFNDSLIIVTSDHGQAFGELSRVRPDVRLVNHSLGIHEVLTHVPLVVRPPGGSDLSDISVPVSLSRVYDCIKNIVSSDEINAKPMTSDKKVTASSHNEPPPNIGNGHWNPFVDEIDKIPWGGTAHAVYENSGDHVSKYVKWGKREATIDISDAQNSMKTSNECGESIDKALTEPITGSLRVTNTSSNNIDQETVEQLKKMGYR
jgi:arylsulfatase